MCTVRASPDGADLCSRTRKRNTMKVLIAAAAPNVAICSSIFARLSAASTREMRWVWPSASFAGQVFLDLFESRVAKRIQCKITRSLQLRPADSIEESALSSQLQASLHLGSNSIERLFSPRKKESRGRFSSISPATGISTCRPTSIMKPGSCRTTNIQRRRLRWHWQAYPP